MTIEVEALIPDFDDFEKLIAEVAQLKAGILITKAELSQLEAQCMREALTNSAYWVGNKRPAMNYCEKIVKELGNTEEDSTMLTNLRIELANKTEAYQLLQGLITLGRDKMDIYRTLSANSRKSFL